MARHGRSSSIGSRPGTGQTVRFAKPFNGVTHGGFASRRRGGRTRRSTCQCIPGNYWARTGRTAASRASGPADEGTLLEAAASGPQGRARAGLHREHPGEPALDHLGPFPCFLNDAG